MTSEPASVQQRITEFWSATASQYERHPGNVVALGTPEYEAWVEALRAMLPPAPSDVLDLGTGTGFVSLMAAALGHRVTAIDLAEPMLQVAREESGRRGLDLRLMHGDAIAPPFPAESFDVVTSRHLLWTLREPERAFANWRALLRPGGRVVAMDALWFSEDDADLPPSDDEQREEGLFEQYYTPETKAALPVMHLREWAPLVEMFERAGLTNVSVTPIPGVAESDDDSSPQHHLLIGYRSAK